jgi:DNA primase
MIDKEIIDQIRASADIVDVISSYIPLVQRGKNYFGVCPFHDDTNPSMSVSKEKQIYTCFSCGATGNVFNFVMDYENVSFRDAVIKIGNMVGIRVDVKDNIKKKKESPLYKMYDLALLMYQNNINSAKGKLAKEYLEKRNINNDLIIKFKIGYSTKDKDTLYKLLKAKNYSDEDILKSGLVVKGDNGYHDIYYDRIMFPLFDTNGRVVGFSGRSYDGSKDFKYINTKETEIFKKGELLYNYHVARDVARRKKEVIVVEGFMDVIRLSSAGIDNVVATMGTAVTKEQATLLKRVAPSITLMFDGDDAGIRATYSCLNELEKINVSAKVVSIPDSLDPDDYIVNNGKEAIERLINSSISDIDFKIKYYKANQNLKDPIVMTEFVNNVIKEIDKINDSVLRELTINKLANISSLERDFIKSKLSTKEVVEPIIVKRERKKSNKYIKAEQALLYYMMRSEEVIGMYNNKVAFMPTERYRYLAREISYFNKTYGYFSIADFLTLFAEDKETIETVGEIESLDLKEDYKISEIDDYINVINEGNSKNQIKNLEEAMKLETDPLKQAKIAEEIRNVRLRREYDERS